MKIVISICEKLISESITIMNPLLYEQAVTHESFSPDKSYQRLEFLGDSIIGFVVAEYAIRRFKKQNESFLTELKIKIVNSNMLSWLCKCMRLHQQIRIVDKLNQDKIYEDVFESFIGAFYIENGIQKTSKLIIAIIENPNFVDMTDLIVNDYNFKKKLMIMMQKNLDGRLPVFHTLNVPETKLFHIVVCHPNGDILGIGISNTIKLAQQSACKMALLNYKPEESDYHYLIDKRKFEKVTDNTENEKNIYITEEIIIDFWKKYDVRIEKINNLDTYQSAFIHKSYNISTEESGHKKYSSNERLNFLGNSLLMYMITEYLYHLYPNHNEGFLTKLKTTEIQNKNLYQYCILLNINKYLILSKNDEFNRNNPSHSEQLFCSLVGAMYIDQGLESVKMWLFNMWKQESKMVNFQDENYKHQLLLKIQENPEYKFYKYPFPSYRIVCNETNYEKKNFTIEVLDPNMKIIGKGHGKTKKEAEQDASKNALMLMNSKTSDDPHNYIHSHSSFVTSSSDEHETTDYFDSSEYDYHTNLSV